MVKVTHPRIHTDIPLLDLAAEVSGCNVRLHMRPCFQLARKQPAWRGYSGTRTTGLQSILLSVAEIQLFAIKVNLDDSIE